MSCNSNWNPLWCACARVEPAAPVKWMCKHWEMPSDTWFICNVNRDVERLLYIRRVPIPQQHLVHSDKCLPNQINMCASGTMNSELCITQNDKQVDKGAHSKFQFIERPSTLVDTPRPHSTCTWTVNTFNLSVNSKSETPFNLILRLISCRWNQRGFYLWHFVHMTSFPYRRYIRFVICSMYMYRARCSLGDSIPNCQYHDCCNWNGHLAANTIRQLIHKQHLNLLKLRDTERKMVFSASFMNEREHSCTFCCDDWVISQPK